jgi:hypothetical protein
MVKFLIGPALVGAGYVAGSFYGADAEQLVHKSPSVTYAAVEQALANMSASGTTFFDGGTPLPYELKVDRTLDQKLVVTLLFAGKQGAEAELSFTPQNDGKDTLVATRIHGDRSVLRNALAGTSKARLAYAPDWMLNLSAKPVLKQLAEQIEQGETASLGLTAGEAQAQWESNLSDEQRQQVAEWRQYEATRPAVDPNAHAEQHASAGGN